MWHHWWIGQCIPTHQSIAAGRIRIWEQKQQAHQAKITKTKLATSDKRRTAIGSYETNGNQRREENSSYQHGDNRAQGEKVRSAVQTGDNSFAFNPLIGGPGSNALPVPQVSSLSSKERNVIQNAPRWPQKRWTDKKQPADLLDGHR